MFGGQIEFRVCQESGGTPVLQYRQVAPTTIRLPNGKSAWDWTEWRDIVEVDGTGESK